MAAADHRAGKAEIADRRHQQRHADDAAKTRAVQRQADRHAALLVEPEAERVGDHAEAGAGPAEGEHGVGEIELPGLAYLSDRDRGHGHRADARDHAIAGAEPLDRLADKGDQRRDRTDRRTSCPTRSATPASRAGAATRRHRRSGHRSRAPSQRSPAGSRRRRCASRHSGSRFRREGCSWGVQCISLCFCLVMAGLVPGIHVLLLTAKTWMAGTSPAMTITTSRARSEIRRPKCQQMATRRRLRRIVEEPLAKHLVAAPFLQRDFVEPARLAG